MNKNNAKKISGLFGCTVTCDEVAQIELTEHHKAKMYIVDYISNNVPDVDTPIITDFKFLEDRKPTSHFLRKDTLINAIIG